MSKDTTQKAGKKEEIRQNSAEKDSNETVETLEEERFQPEDEPQVDGEIQENDKKDNAEVEEKAESEVLADSEEEEQAEDEAVEETEPAEETQEEMEARLKAEISELNDKYVRLLAEFENFKRRNAQELQNRFKFANQSLALNIISGLDNLERALDQANDGVDENMKEFVTGIEMVKQQLYEAFEKNNIERIFPKGELFDPNKHEAMGVVETEEIEPDHIAEVFQAGYILHDRVIRPAMVQVAKKK